MGRGEESPPCDPGSELRRGGREKRRAKIVAGKWDEKKNSNKRGAYFLRRVNDKTKKTFVTRSLVARNRETSPDKEARLRIAWKLDIWDPLHCS